MGKDSQSQKFFTQKIISFLMNEARKHLPLHSRKPTPTKSSLNPRKRKISPSVSATTNLSHRFPNRFSKPTVLHNRSTHTRRGTCVYCSAEYLDKQTKGKKLNFNKTCKRTILHCSYCTATLCDEKDTCFLCKEHFNTFHRF